MLTDPSASAEGFRGIRVFHRLAGPDLWFQNIDHVLPVQKVQTAAAVMNRQLPILTLRVHDQHPFPGLPEIGQQQLHQVGLALAGVAQDQDIAVGFVIPPTVQVYQNVGAVLVPPDIEALGIGLTGEVEGEHISHRAGRQHTLELTAEAVPAKGHGGKKPFLLPQGQPVRRDLGAGQLHADIRLQAFQRAHALGLQLQEHSTVDQGLLLPAQSHKELLNIQQILLRLDGFVDIRVPQLQAVFSGSVIGDLPLLIGFHQPVIDPQCHPGMIRQMRQDGLLLRTWRVFPDHPDTAVGVAHKEVVGIEFNSCGSNAVEETLSFHPCLYLHSPLLFSEQLTQRYAPPFSYSSVPPQNTGLRLRPAACPHPWRLPDRWQGTASAPAWSGGGPQSPFPPSASGPR